MIAAVQVSHAMWFPSLLLRNLVLARGQFLNATGEMTQLVNCLISAVLDEISTNHSLGRASELAFDFLFALFPLILGDAFY